MPLSTKKTVKRNRVNVRKPDIMIRVKEQITNHYKSSIVERLKSNNGVLKIGNTSILLAKQFGFCYGVERAIDLAYASRKVFENNRIFLIGEIIHNQEVNKQLKNMNIISLPWQKINKDYDDLTDQDVVIVPAFGAPTSFMDKIESHGCMVVDTTCGDVMKVWKRVKGFAKNNITSIIHGKAEHEETLATSSRAVGDNKNGHFLVILTLEDADYVCNYIVNGGNKQDFLNRFGNKSISKGFNPDINLNHLGVANQTTMLKSETEKIQQKFKLAIEKRDGTQDNFEVFDTICGATQERQDALFEMLKSNMDILIVVGGYNSSNTTHLVEIGNEELPTFFIKNSDSLLSLEEIIHFDINEKKEKNIYSKRISDKEKEVTVGITAGASCPNNLIEDTVLKIFSLRGVSKEDVYNFN